MKLFVIIFIICIFLSSFLIEAKEKKEASINIKKFFTTSQKNIFEDFIKCLTSNEYRNPKNNVKLFFKGDHTIEIPSSYGKLKETIINGRIMTLRYTKSSVHKLVFIDLIENRCLRVLTVKDI